jgi:hypothetical protein
MTLMTIPIGSAEDRLLDLLEQLKGNTPEHEAAAKTAREEFLSLLEPVLGRGYGSDDGSRVMFAVESERRRISVVVHVHRSFKSLKMLLYIDDHGRASDPNEPTLYPFHRASNAFVGKLVTAPDGTKSYQRIVDGLAEDFASFVEAALQLKPEGSVPAFHLPNH